MRPEIAAGLPDYAVPDEPMDIPYSEIAAHLDEALETAAQVFGP